MQDSSTPRCGCSVAQARGLWDGRVRLPAGGGRGEALSPPKGGAPRGPPGRGTPLNPWNSLEFLGSPLISQ